MIFRFILFNFHILLKTGITIASLRNKAFKKKLKENNFLMQVKMTNENKGRYYKLSSGKLTSGGKVLSEEADIAIVWPDSSTALRTLMKFKPKTLVESILNAITAGKLMVEMDVANTFWFGTIMKDMGKAFIGR